VKPDPTRIYVARPPGGGYVSAASKAAPDLLDDVVHPGMKLRGNHPVVIEHPEWWVDVADDPEMAALAQALRGHEPATLPDPLATSRPHGPEWVAIVRKYRAVGAVRPSQEAVARKMEISETTLKGKLRDLGVDDWRRVHALVESEP
jgi:hypothetical protein